MKATAIAPALLVFTALGCSEPLTGPDGPREVSTVSEASFSAGLASVGWNAQARAMVLEQRLSPTTAARAYALLAIAQYGAVLAVDEGGSDGLLQPDGFGAGGRSQYEARRGAVAGASAQVLAYLVPAAGQMLAQRVESEGELGPGNVHPQFTRGVTAGRAFGDRVIAWAKADGFVPTMSVPIPTGPGKWIGSVVAGASHAFMVPLTLTSPSQFRAPEPPPVGSAEFLRDLQEVVSISQTRTPEQRQIAIDRNLAGGTITGLGFFNELASSYIVESGLDERAAAHVLATMNAAGSDAVISCWDSKLHYFYIRPSQVNSSITLPIGLPGHPSYPSGHSCISGAASHVLAAFFPAHTADLNWHVVENGLSRIYAGIHYRFDVTAGQQIGRSVGGQVLAVDQARGVTSVIP